MSGSTNGIPNEYLEPLAQQLELYGKAIFDGPLGGSGSSLYSQLCLHLAKDPEMLSFIAVARQSKSLLPSLLFAAVHFLLLKGLQHPLIAFYPDLTTTPLPPTEAYPHFRAFCQEYAQQVHHLMLTRQIQVNDVGRCACLLPAFQIISRRIPNRPLALVEIGASAGLLLWWDRYGYDYGPLGYVGDVNSPVQVSCTLQGQYQPLLDSDLPQIVYRVGVDLAPIDVRDADSACWLRALTWPEQRASLSALNAAIEFAQINPPQLITGNATTVLPDVLKTVPLDAIVCIYHSVTFIYLSDEERSQILKHITHYGAQRDLFHISFEIGKGESLGQVAVHLGLSSYQNGNIKQELLAYCDARGQNMEWLCDNATTKNL